MSSQPPLMSPCLICGRVLDRAFAMSAVPKRGLTFEARGHPRSDVFGGVYADQSLSVNVCDGCMTTASQEGRVVMLTYPEPERPEPAAEAWTAGG